MQENYAELGHFAFLESLNAEAIWSENGIVNNRRGISLYSLGSPLFFSNNLVRYSKLLSTERVIEMADDFFSKRKVEGYRVIARIDNDSDLIDAALSADFTLAGGLEPQLSCSSHVRIVDLPESVVLQELTPVNVADFMHLWNTVFFPNNQMEFKLDYSTADFFLAPHVRGVVAYEDGEPIACGLTVLAGGVGVVVGIATVENARRRGIGAAITVNLHNTALSSGALWTLLNASPMGESVYRKLGYTDLQHYQRLVRKF